MIGRIVRPADFERVLATAPCSRSAHFAVHHVHGGPSRGSASQRQAPGEAVVPTVSPDLSTAPPVAGPVLVDESSGPSAKNGPAGHWLGLVVPKRHAKRAVTRNLIKRQLRAAMARHAGRLPPGLWVVRLRQGFDRQAFPSPASGPLREAAHDEIEVLFSRAARPPVRPR
jgi:ribonuclease P protein component